MTLGVLTEVLAGAVAAKAKPPPPPVETYDSLLPLADTAVLGTFAAFFDTFMLDEVTPLRTSVLAAVADVNRLLRDSGGFSLPPALVLNNVDKELKDAAGRTVVHVKSNVEQWAFKLGGDDKEMWEPTAALRALPLNRPVVLRDAYEKYRAWKQEIPGWTSATTVPEALEALRWSSALEGFFIRILAAKKAADRAHVSLAQALALYREEGNLVVPMSANHVLNNLPPFESGLLMFHGNWPKIGSTMRWGLWSFPGDGVTDGASMTTPLAQNPANEQRIRTMAVIDWCIAVVGFDFLTSNVLSPGQSWSFNKMGFTGFAKENRVSLGVPFWPDTFAVFQELFDPFDTQIADRPGLGANLQIMKWPTTNAERYVVAPRDPVALVSMILTEALVFKRALANGSKHGPIIKPPPRLEYLAYHTQDTIDPKDPKEDLFTWILVSAAVAVKTLRRPITGPLAKFKPLSDSLQDGALGANAIRSKLDFDPVQKALSLKKPGGLTASDKSKFRSQHVEVFEKLKEAGWWDDAAHMSDLADFIMEAGESDWGAFFQHRANASRHARLLAFYEWLI